LRQGPGSDFVGSGRFQLQHRAERYRDPVVAVNRARFFVELGLRRRNRWRHHLARRFLQQLELAVGQRLGRFYLQ
jgi:hypothetical protein